MTEEQIYNEQQEYNRYQELINTKEILTQEEYELCKAWNADEAWKYLNDIGNGQWLNINVYSEVDKEEFDLRKEMGF
jgi:NTP pyrophosphatase (non-canonical NTP hydrolase)